MSFDDLRQEIRLHEQGMRRAMGIEIMVAIPMTCFLAGFALSAVDAPIFTRIGAALGAAGGLFVVGRIWPRWRQPPIPIDVGLADTVARYRVRLEHQHHSLRTAWLWYGLPVGAGPAVILAGTALNVSQPVLAVAGVIVGFVLVEVFFDRAVFARTARGPRQRIDALDDVKEPS